MTSCTNALGLAVHLLGQLPGHVPAGDVREHLLDVLGRKATQGHAREGADAPELGKGPRQRVGAVDLDVAVGADDEQPRESSFESLRTSGCGLRTSGERAGPVLEEVEGQPAVSMEPPAMYW
jgi:hypothetical protein